MKTEKRWSRFKINITTPNWIEYAIYAVLALVVMLFYKYWDGKSLTVWSTVLWDCVYDGNIYDYYAVVHQNLNGAPQWYCGYNYLVLIPWAVWNLPIWILQRFCGMRIVEHTLMMAWSQMFLVVLLLVTLFYSRRIMQYFGVDKKIQAWSLYLIVTCPFTFVGIFVSGQSDMIVIAAAVMAVYYLLENKQWLFLLLMAFSISAKPFFIFAFIAVILLVEKNVIWIGLKLISSMVPMVLFNMIYKNAPLYQESVNQGTGNAIIQNTIANCIGATGGNASIVIMGLLLLYFAAYCIRYQKENVEKKQYIIYMMFAPMAVYFAFANYEYYRRIYLIPFLILMMAIHCKFWSVNLILEKALAVCGIFLSLYGPFTAYLKCVNEGIMKRFGLLQDIDQCRYPSLANLIVAKLGDNAIMVQTIGISVYVAVTGLLLFINFPYIARRLPFPEYRTARVVYWVDTVFAGLLILLLALCYFNKIA